MQLYGQNSLPLFGCVLEYVWVVPRVLWGHGVRISPGSGRPEWHQANMKEPAVRGEPRAREWWGQRDKKHPDSFYTARSMARGAEARGFVTLWMADNDSGPHPLHCNSHLSPCCPVRKSVLWMVQVSDGALTYILYDCLKLLYSILNLTVMLCHHITATVIIAVTKCGEYKYSISRWRVAIDFSPPQIHLSALLMVWSSCNTFAQRV